MITARDHLNCLLNAEGEQIIINELDVDAFSAAIKALELVGDFAHTGKESKILLHLKSLASALGQNKARIVCEPVGNVDTIWVDENDLLALRFAINKLEREETCGRIPVKDRFFVDFNDGVVREQANGIIPQHVEPHLCGLFSSLQEAYEALAKYHMGKYEEALKKAEETK